MLYCIDPGHQPELDAAEDLGRGYAIKQVEVRMAAEGWTPAFTYVALQIDDGMRPFSWYLEHVLRGAREHALPASYLAMLETEVGMTDSDVIRHRTELAIYR